MPLVQPEVEEREDARPEERKSSDKGLGERRGRGLYQTADCLMRAF
jgi:hypothetical protein